MITGLEHETTVPVRPDHLLKLAHSATASGDPSVPDAYEILLNNSSRNIRMRARRGLARWELVNGNLDRAVALLKCVLEYHPDDEGVQREMTDALAKQRRRASSSASRVSASEFAQNLRIRKHSEVLRA